MIDSGRLLTVAATTFRSWTSTSTINAMPVVQFVPICCCWYAAGAPKKDERHSLATLTRTSAHQSRVAHQEDGSHGFGCRRTNPTTLNCGYTCSTFALRWPKATDVATEAALRRSQDPGAEVSRDLSLFYVSQQFVNQVTIAPDCSTCWPTTAFSIGGFSDGWYRWLAVRRAFSTWCVSEVLFCPSWPTTACIHLSCHFFDCDVTVIVAMMRCVSNASIHLTCMIGSVTFLSLMCHQQLRVRWLIYINT